MIETAKEIKRKLFLIIILTLCLSLVTCTASFARKPSDIRKINLNDGKPVIEEESTKFKPGDTLTRSFFVENLSDSETYYILYFENIEGSLKDILEVKIYDEEKLILSGILNDLTKITKRDGTCTLKPKEKKNLMITFHFPKTGGNYLKSSTVSFDLKARAEWAKK